MHLLGDMDWTLERFAADSKAHRAAGKSTLPVALSMHCLVLAVPTYRMFVPVGQNGLDVARLRFSLTLGFEPRAYNRIVVDCAVRRSVALC